MGIMEHMEENSHVKKINKMLEGIAYSADFEDVENKILTIQKTRAIRSASEKNFSNQFEDMIYKIALENTRNRATLSEIYITLSIKRNKLRSHLGDIKKFLLTSYGAQLKKTLKTVKERDFAIDSVLHGAIKRQAQFDDTMTTIEFILKDIDNSKFNLDQIITATEIKSRNRQMKIGKS